MLLSRYLNQHHRDTVFSVFSLIFPHFLIKNILLPVPACLRAGADRSPKINRGFWVMEVRATIHSEEKFPRDILS